MEIGLFMKSGYTVKSTVPNTLVDAAMLPFKMLPIIYTILQQDCLNIYYK